MNMLQEIADWIRDTDTSLELRIGAWSDSDTGWYAVIKRARDGHLIFGESTYGAESIEEALELLWTEIDRDGAKGELACY